jgi:Spy/CpxP family protein refolding chaperone
MRHFLLSLLIFAGFNTYAQFNIKNAKAKKAIETTQTTLDDFGLGYDMSQFNDLNLTDEQKKQITELYKNKKETFLDDEKNQLKASKENSKKEFEANKKELKEADASTLLDFKNRKDKKIKELGTKKDSLKTATNQSKDNLNKKAQFKEEIDQELKQILTPEQYAKYEANTNKK